MVLDYGDHSSLYTQIEEFYGRELSFDSDVLNAMNGVFSAYGRKEVSGVVHQPSIPHHLNKIAESLSKLTEAILETREDKKTYRVTNHFFGVPVTSTSSANDVVVTSLTLGLTWGISGRKSRKDCETDRITRRPGWPSWSWASFKGGRLEFYNVFIIPEDKAEIFVTLTRGDGTLVDLASFGELKADYTLFEPWIDMTTWTLELSGELLAAELRERLIGPWLEPPLFNWRSDRSPEFFYLDPGEFVGRTPRSVTAVFLRSRTGPRCRKGFDMEALALICAETETGKFERVGLWRAGFTSFERLENNQLKVVQDNGREMRWQRKTVRLV
jgi:hypothetical protein